MVCGIAEGRRGGADPCFRLLFLRQGSLQTIASRRTITNCLQVGMYNRFPYLLEGFGHSATALGEAGIAHLAVVDQYQSGGLIDRFLDQIAGLAGDALVALAVVVCTNIKQGMVFPVPPTDVSFIRFVYGLVIFAGLPDLLPFYHLGNEPGAGGDRMRFQELHAAGCAHFRGDDTDQVIFQREYIDGMEALPLPQQHQRSFE